MSFRTDRQRKCVMAKLTSGVTSPRISTTSSRSKKPIDEDDEDSEETEDNE